MLLMAAADSTNVSRESSPAHARGGIEHRQGLVGHSNACFSRGRPSLHAVRRRSVRSRCPSSSSSSRSCRESNERDAPRIRSEKIRCANESTRNGSCPATSLGSQGPRCRRGLREYTPKFTPPPARPVFFVFSTHRLQPCLIKQ